jgi:2-hydroxyglutarate dehydrogenase
MNMDGSFSEDFIFDQGEGKLGERMLHVRNAPSPGATSSLAIAKMITDKAHTTFNWK